MKKSSSWILFLLFVFFIWMFAALYINNPYILPSPINVLKEFFLLFQQKTFYISTFYSLIRVLISLFISFLFGCICAFASIRFPSIADILSKFTLIIRCLPNVTIIILLLFWVSREVSVFLVSFLLLFPIVFENMYHALLDIQQTWHDVLFIYHKPFIYLVKKVYLPLLKPSIYSSLLSCSSLGFKVGIMAEILSSVQIGLGRQIQFYRVNFELNKVMAYTLWILIIVFIFDFILKKVLNKLFVE
ncbi:MAG: hypothetical protein PUH10_00915 [Erysipelotrichaceae bacterium]|uniref:ABC transporter permease n=1 Tax=Floccifex sp. TaxID=2815810 RepID=UPI0029FF094F|nr:ABC transporter permease subunit [Floccifex sp.]MDD7280552.1 hypothetical protein [Erysipelotrichaceae bacterium]MDY2959128.1 hypothetical protein [Floccifex sp.]